MAPSSKTKRPVRQHIAAIRLTEQLLLTLSLVVSLVIGMVGVVVAVTSNTISVFMISGYALANGVISLLARFVSSRIPLRSSARVNFGYFKVDPIVTNLHSMLLVGIASFALIMASYSLIHHPLHAVYTTAAMFTLLATLLSAGMFYLAKTGADRSNSSLLRSTSYLWSDDCLISSITLFTLILAYFGAKTPWPEFMPYADPVLSLLLALYILRQPIKLIYTHLMDAVGAHPQKPAAELVQEVVEKALEDKAEINPGEIKLSKIGEKYYIDVGFVLVAPVDPKRIKFACNQIERTLMRYIALMEVRFFLDLAGVKSQSATLK